MPELTPLERLKTGNAPRGLRLAIADGLIPLDGDDLVQAYTILATDPDEEVVFALRENLPNLPRQFLIQIARQSSTKDRFLDFMAHVFIDDADILNSIVLNKNVQDQTLVYLSNDGPPSVLDMIGTNKNRMFTCPHILDALLSNTRIPSVLKYSLEEFKERFKDSFVRDKDAGFEDEPATPMEEDASLLEADKMETEAETTVESGAEVSYLEEEDVLLTPEELAATEQLDEEPSEAIPDSTADTSMFESGDSEASFEGEDEWDEAYLTSGVTQVETPGTEAGFTADDLDFVGEIEFEDVKEESASQDNNVKLEGWDDLGFDEEDDSEETEEEAEDFDISKSTEDEEKIVDTRTRLMKLGAADKLVLAKMGTKQERAVLVRDANVKVAIAVVEGPKMSEFEVQLIASNRSVNEDVLRAIYNHRIWGQKPLIRRELVLNPKTPMALSLRMLNTLNDLDLKEVMKSKEIPYGLAASAKRIFDIREQRRSRKGK